MLIGHETHIRHIHPITVGLRGHSAEILSILRWVLSPHHPYPHSHQILDEMSQRTRKIGNHGVKLKIGHIIDSSDPDLPSNLFCTTASSSCAFSVSPLPPHDHNHKAIAATGKNFIFIMCEALRTNIMACNEFKDFLFPYVAAFNLSNSIHQPLIVITRYFTQMTKLYSLSGCFYLSIALCYPNG